MSGLTGTRVTLGSLLVWEFARLGVLFVAVLRHFDFLALPETHLVILWFGSGQIVVAAGLGAALYDPVRFRRLLPILALAKALTLVLGGAVLVSGVMIEPGNAVVRLGPDVFTAVVPLIVVNLDLISVIFLLSSSRTRAPRLPRRNHLPQFRETTLEDE